MLIESLPRDFSFKEPRASKASVPICAELFKNAVYNTARSPLSNTGSYETRILPRRTVDPQGFYVMFQPTSVARQVNANTSVQSQHKTHESHQQTLPCNVSKDTHDFPSSPNTLIQHHSFPLSHCTASGNRSQAFPASVQSSLSSGGRVLGSHQVDSHVPCRSRDDPVTAREPTENMSPYSTSLYTPNNTAHQVCSSQDPLTEVYVSEQDASLWKQFYPTLQNSLGATLQNAVESQCIVNATNLSSSYSPEVFSNAEECYTAKISEAPQHKPAQETVAKHQWMLNTNTREHVAQQVPWVKWGKTGSLGRYTRFQDNDEEHGEQEVLESTPDHSSLVQRVNCEKSTLENACVSHGYPAQFVKQKKNEKHKELSEEECYALGTHMKSSWRSCTSTVSDHFDDSVAASHSVQGPMLPSIVDYLSHRRVESCSPRECSYGFIDPTRERDTPLSLTDIPNITPTPQGMKEAILLTHHQAPHMELSDGNDYKSPRCNDLHHDMVKTLSRARLSSTLIEKRDNETQEECSEQYAPRDNESDTRQVKNGKPKIGRRLIRPSCITCGQLKLVMPIVLHQFERFSVSRKALCRQLVGCLYPNSPKPSPNFLLNTLLPLFHASNLLGFDWNFHCHSSLSFLRLWLCNQPRGKELIQHFRVHYNAPTGKGYRHAFTSLPTISQDSYVLYKPGEELSQCHPSDSDSVFWVT